MFATWMSILISGILMGTIYALVAGGLTLIWGVLRIVNLAHGEFLMLGAFATFYLFPYLGSNPILALPIIAPFFFLIGAVVYLLVVKRVVNAPELMSLLLTFGISIFISGVSNCRISERKFSSFWGNYLQTTISRWRNCSVFIPVHVLDFTKNQNRDGDTGGGV